MDISNIKTVAVIGAGRMGQQIALNTAIHGYNVNLNDVSEELLAQVKSWAKDYLDGRVAKGKLTSDEATAAATRLNFCTSVGDAVKSAQIVVEAIVEDLEIKTNFFKELSALAPKDAIFASNSSYIVSSEFAGIVDNPSRLANFHYFNPALVLKLVEVVKGGHTSDETINTLMEFAKKTGKTPIRINKEIDGFVVNRVLRAIRDESFYLVEEGVVSPEDLDIGLELGLNHPMGPFRLLDLAGVDLFYHSSTKRWKDTGVKPHGYDIIKKMYEVGDYGKKTGKGFYDYNK